MSRPHPDFAADPADYVRMFPLGTKVMADGSSIRTECILLLETMEYFRAVVNEKTGCALLLDRIQTDQLAKADA